MIETIYEHNPEQKVKQRVPEIVNELEKCEQWLKLLRNYLKCTKTIDSLALDICMDARFLSINDYQKSLQISK